MASNRRHYTRRAALGHFAIAASSIAMPGVSMAMTLTAAGSSPLKVRFKAGDSFAVGNLYTPGGYQPASRYPAVVIGGSLTSVKEQMGGIYAIEMAERGFLALAIDYRSYGESGGEPRQYEDPESKAADLSAAVGYLAARQDVLPDRVALLGICTSGGTVLYTAARDSRIGAVACVASHLAEPDVTNPVLYGGAEGVAARRAAGRGARAEWERTGKNATILAYHNTDLSASHVGPMEYYMDKTRGGGVKEWTNAFAVMSWEPWLDFNPLRAATQVTKPTLIVHTDNCALPDQARKAHALLKGPRSLHWTSGEHFQFYDDSEKVREAADVAALHFRTYLI
jgi:fermentation-respiration switch protein FrsA (DUF1100 family)